MLALLPILALSLQVAPPDLPAGCSAAFHARVLAVEKLLDQSDFDGAKKLLISMPGTVLHYVWDDSQVPADQRELFAKGRDVSLDMWRRGFQKATFQESESGPLSIQFTKRNGLRPGTGLPMGMNLIQEDQTLRAVIGLERGKPAGPTDLNDVANDLGRAVSTFLGVGELPISSTAMYIQDESSHRILPVPPQAVVIAEQNIEAVEALRQAAEAHQRITPAEPKFFSDTPDLDLGDLMQGDSRNFGVVVQNLGQAPLKLWVKPECGCMTLEEPSAIPPGGKTEIHLSFDPVDFKGRVNKKVFVVSNDPSEGYHTFNLTVNIRPAYQFLSPKGDVLILGDSGADATVYLACNQEVPFDIRQAGITGVSGKVDFDPWEGTMADPANGEGPLPRKGYKLTLHLSSKVPPGRSPGNLVLYTDSEKYRTPIWAFSVQKGIVAVPDQLFFGEMDGPRTLKFLVSRPGQPFKITGVTTSSQSLKVSYKANSDSEFALQATYDGKGPSGNYGPSILVKTNDPKQPEINIPVIGTIP